MLVYSVDTFLLLLLAFKNLFNGCNLRQLLTRNINTHIQVINIIVFFKWGRRGVISHLDDTQKSCFEERRGVSARHTTTGL